jgi:hypothetical protein
MAGGSKCLFQCLLEKDSLASNWSAAHATHSFPIVHINSLFPSLSIQTLFQRRPILIWILGGEGRFYPYCNIYSTVYTASMLDSSYSITPLFRTK